MTAPPTSSLPRPGEPSGGLLGRFLAPLFGRVRLDEEAADRLRDAYARGTVVHVFRASRLTDPLYLLFALRQLGLPRPSWLHDHYASTEPRSVQALISTVEAQCSAVLFLRKPRTWLNPSGTYTDRHVEALLELQRSSDRPLLLLPETLQWTTRPVGLRPTLLDSIFGNREAPGRMREVVGFLWNHRHARFHVGAPVDLRAVLEREGKSEDRITTRKVRFSISHHLAREEQIRTGPMVRTMARTRQMVLNDPTVRRYIGQQADKGKSADELERKAERLLRGIAADMRHGWLRVLDAIIDKVWRRIYDGIVVDQEGLAKVRRAARRGPVVLMPSHKSHIDYIVLSQVFFKDGLMPPLVAAGENLNFWPMGFIFRRSGAFFIRRSFSEKLYAVVFSAYVRRLLKEGHALEFFIEGGRSRTGKLLPPRTGLLTWCVEPVLEGTIGDVTFVPVSIGYEKIIEAGAYARELAGGEKTKEDARALLSSAKLLRSRYGRVYVDFAEPLSLHAFAASRGIEAGDEKATTDRKELVTQLGHRIVFGINEVTRTTPTSIVALVLLARAQRGLGEGELYDRADWIIGLLTSRGARISATLSPATRQPALRQAIERFAAEGQVKTLTAPDGETIYQIDDAGRQALDYYKNNILHFLVPAAVVALSVLSTAPSSDRERVAQTAQRLSRLLKNEFSFRGDLDFDDNFRNASETLMAHGVLPKRAPWQLSDEATAYARELAGLLAPFFAAYRVTAIALNQTRAKPMPKRKFVAAALTSARREAMTGSLAWPEAAVMPTIKNALTMLKAEDIVTMSGGIQLADGERRDDLVKELTHYLHTVKQ